MIDRNCIKHQTGLLFKSVVLGLISFFVIAFIMSLIVWITPAPEKWMNHYNLAVLSATCLLVGISAGFYNKRKGLFFGFLYSAIVLMLIIIILMLWNGNQPVSLMMKISYLVCIVFGGIGGLIGVNSK